MAARHTNPKNTFASIKSYQNLVKSLFYESKNQRKSLTDSLWATVSSLNTKFDVFTSPKNLVSMIQIMIMRIF
jgi:hypothetical protein